VWSALLGAITIGSIPNGMDLLALQSSVTYMVTGGVLVAAVIVDALARRRRQVRADGGLSISQLGPSGTRGPPNILTRGSQTRRSKRMQTHRLSRPIAVAAAVVVIGGAAAGIVSATTGNGSPGDSTGQPAKTGFAAKAGSNARSGPAAGGVVGTVNSVSTSSFTVSTSAGQKVTVNKRSSTTYRKGTRSTPASALIKGKAVLVLGKTNGTTITATQVIVRPASGAAPTFSPSKVVPFTRGAPTTAKQDGQIPTNYSQGSGSIVSGAPANKATTAALAAYPGGIVDRVVKLSDGEYEVHNIGVNWPHHIFVDRSFKVVGAN
jgi:hypothetical protein